MSKIRLYGGTSGYIELAAPDVSDDATLTLPTGAAGFVPGNGGIGSNAVATLSNTTFSTSSTSFTDITGLSVTITPSSATSKVFVIATATISEGVSGPSAQVALARGGTPISGQGSGGFSQESTASIGGVSLAVIDSPATTSATTYSVQMKVDSGGTGYVNRIPSSATPTFGSSIVAIEVAA